MIKPKFYGKIKEGRIAYDDSELIRQHLLKFQEDQEVEMTIEKRHKRRTSGRPGEETNFNGYYWAVIIRIISDTIGELDDNETHNLLQMIFNKKGVMAVDPDTKQSRNYEIPRGTKNLSGSEFAEYCSKIRMWASIPGNLCERGIYIPEPNEADYE